MTDQRALVERIATHCETYKGGIASRSMGQTALNLGLYAGLVAAMFVSLSYGAYWLFALLTLPAAGILTRLFTVQHDCGHGSYFQSRAANNRLGQLISVLTFTPYGSWRDAHNRHHASSGNLSRRGVGGIDTLTVAEFKGLSPWKRFAYRVYRNPLVILLIGPPLYIVLMQRLPLAGALPFAETYIPLETRYIWRSVLALNIALVAFYGGLAMLFGPGTVALVFLPPVVMAAWAGGWLFYVQHQYEDTYWEEGKEWNFQEAAVLGSSYYELPAVLQWFTGNIGLHHIHHLCSLIPNYRLQECFDSSEDLKSLPRMSLGQSLKSVPLSLWDEEGRKLISFKSA